VLLRLALLSVVVLAGPGVATAAGASLVYLKGGNVWVANADGTGARAVTRDGGPGDGGYLSPSQADDGTIVALRGAFLHRFDRGGRRIGTPRRMVIEPLPTLMEVPLSVTVSPDGRTVALDVALHETGPFDPSCGCYRTGRHLATYILYRDAASGAERGRTEVVADSLWTPSWIDNGRVLAFRQFALFGPQVFTAAIGAPVSVWYQDPEPSPLPGGSNAVFVGDGELTRAGDRLAVVRHHSPDASTGTIQINAVGDLTSAPTPLCTVGPGRQIAVAAAPSWSHDGALVAWHEADGIHVTPVDPTVPGCGLAPRLLLPGASNPDFGPAALGVADRVRPRVLAFALRATRAGRVARVRLSERVTLAGVLHRQRRGGFAVTRRIGSRALGAGVRQIPLGRLGPGRYRLRLSLEDAAGNRATVTRFFTVPRR
jgi:hypothetical protein